MITGIGTDLIEIRRVEKACEKEAFFTRCFTEEEQKLVKGNPSKAAGNFAGKEAVSKVFGTGFRGIALRDIEILRDPLGKPYVRLYNRAREIACEQHVSVVHISLSNTKEHALAYAVGERL